MKKKIILMMSLMFIVVSVNLTGCGGGNDTSATGSTSPNAVTENEKTATKTDNAKKAGALALDFDKIAGNVVVDGKNIKLPTTLEELGADYSLGGPTFEWIDEPIPHKGYLVEWYKLLYKSNEICSVCTVCDGDKKKEDRIICGIFCGIFSSEGVNASIDGLSIGDNISKMKDMWGEETKKLEALYDIYEYHFDPDYIDVNTTKEDLNIIKSFRIGYFSSFDK